MRGEECISVCLADPLMSLEALRSGMADPVIRVQGRGRLRADPDLTVLVFQVRGRSTDYADAVERGAREVEAIRAALEARGTARTALKTTRFFAGRDEEWDPKREKRLFLGYAAVHGLRLEIARTTDAGGVLDAIAEVAPGAEIQISFELSDPDGFRQRLLAAAVEAARRNAATIAEASGVGLGPIAGIEYGWSDVHVASPLMYEARAARGAPVPTSFEPEAVEGAESVTVTWVIERGAGVTP
jgi:uncharacterized protein